MKKGFTLLEVITAVAVLAIAVTLVMVGAKHVRSSSYSTLCMNNLRQISLAVANYYNDHREYPVSLPYDTLPGQLASYVSTQKIFLCPEDTGEQADSYSEFYVYRGQDVSGTEYMLGCPRHRNAKMSMNIFALGTAKSGKIAQVVTDSMKLKPGESVTGGSMALADGSVVSSSGVEMVLIQSFRMDDGKLYTIIKVPDGEEGSITADVIPGSALEIVTPSAIAAVRGTTFIVQIGYQDGLPISNIGVTAGEVAVKPLKGKNIVEGNPIDAGKREISLLPGNSVIIQGIHREVNKDSIKIKIQQLQRKIKAGLAKGNKMTRELCLLRRLIDTYSEGTTVPAWVNQDILNKAKEEKDKTTVIPITPPGQGTTPPGQNK